MSKISLVGYGKLGSGISAAIMKSGINLNIIVRSESSRQNAIKDGLSNSQIFTGIENLPETDIYLLATRDSQLDETQKRLATILSEKLKEKYVIHFSASLPPSLLSDSLKLGAHAAAIHPFQTFFRGANTAMDGIAWGIDCMSEDEDFLSNFVKSIGGVPVILPEGLKDNKPLYHLAGVAVSNLMVAPLALAKLFAEKAGIDPAVFFPPIVRETIENNLLSLKGKELALTGPLIRGDGEIIESHLKALEDSTDLNHAYRLMSSATAILAHSQGAIPDEIFNKINKILNIGDLK